MSCSRLVVVRQTYVRSVVHVIEHVAVMSIGVGPHRCEHCKSRLCDGSALWSTQHVLKIRWRSAFVWCTHCDIAIGGDLVDMTCKSKKGKGKFLYSAVSSPHDHSKRLTLYFPDRPVHSDTISASLGSIQSHVTINARRLLAHISNSVYSQVLIYM